MKLINMIASLLTEAWRADPSGDVFSNREDLLDEIEREYLPSGSGFDSGCKIVREYALGLKEVRINFSYHVMHSDGYYTRWIHSAAIVTPTFDSSGLTIRLVHLASFKKDLVDDYVYDSIYQALSAEVGREFVKGEGFHLVKKEIVHA